MRCSWTKRLCRFRNAAFSHISPSTQAPRCRSFLGAGPPPTRRSFRRSRGSVATSAGVWVPRRLWRRVALDVDQMSRPLVLRGMVADVRKPLVSHVWNFATLGGTIVDNYVSRLVHRQPGQCASLLERAGAPILPVRPREQMDSVV